MTKFILVFLSIISIFTEVDCLIKDVVFVLDRSGSINESQFDQGIEFISNVVDHLAIGSTEFQIAVVSYSRLFRLEFFLNEHLSKLDLLTAINNLKGTSTSGSTYTGEALRYVQTTVLQTNNGARQGADVAVVVLTDGQSYGKLIPGTEADNLRANGVEVFSVGVGTTTLTELQSIANDPDSFYVMYVSDFVYLCNLIPALVPKLDSSLTATLLAECQSDPVPTTPWPDMSTTRSTEESGQSTKLLPTTPWPDMSTTRSTEESGLSPGSIAGIVFAVVILTTITAASVWYFKFKTVKKKKVHISFVPGLGLVTKEI